MSSSTATQQLLLPSEQIQTRLNSSIKKSGIVTNSNNNNKVTIQRIGSHSISNNNNSSNASGTTTASSLSSSSSYISTSSKVGCRLPLLKGRLKDSGKWKQPIYPLETTGVVGREILSAADQQQETGASGIINQFGKDNNNSNKDSVNGLHHCGMITRTLASKLLSVEPIVESGKKDASIKVGNNNNNTNGSVLSSGVSPIVKKSCTYGNNTKQTRLVIKRSSSNDGNNINNSNNIVNNNNNNCKSISRSGLPQSAIRLNLPQSSSDGPSGKIAQVPPVGLLMKSSLVVVRRKKNGKRQRLDGDKEGKGRIGKRQTRTSIKDNTIIQTNIDGSNTRSSVDSHKNTNNIIITNNISGNNSLAPSAQVGSLLNNPSPPPRHAKGNSSTSYPKGSMVDDSPKNVTENETLKDEDITMEDIAIQEKQVHLHPLQDDDNNENAPLPSTPLTISLLGSSSNFLTPSTATNTQTTTVSSSALSQQQLLIKTTKSESLNAPISLNINTSTLLACDRDILKSSKPLSSLLVDGAGYGQDWLIHHKHREPLFQPFQPSFGTRDSFIESGRLAVIRSYWESIKHHHVSPATIHVAVNNFGRLLQYHYNAHHQQQKQSTNQNTNNNDVTSAASNNFKIGSPTKSDWALLAVVAYRLALKYEERPEVLWEVPNCWSLFPIFDDWEIDRSEENINKVELSALSILGDSLDTPLSPMFLSRYLSVGGWPSTVTKEYHNLGLFLLSLATFSVGAGHLLENVEPSKLSAAALVLSIKIINVDREVPSGVLSHLDGCSRNQQPPPSDSNNGTVVAAAPCVCRYEYFPERLSQYVGYSYEDLHLVIRGLSSLLRHKPKESDVLKNYFPVWGDNEWQ